MYEAQIQAAADKFAALLKEQLTRVDTLKEQGDFIDYAKLDKIIIGVCGGDGIGPTITAQSRRVLEHLLADEVAAGMVGHCIKEFSNLAKILPSVYAEEKDNW